MKPPSTMAAKTTATPRARTQRHDLNSQGGRIRIRTSPPVMAVTQLLQGRYRAWAALTLAVS